MRIKRKIRRIGIFSVIFACVILILAMVGNTGVVRAEDEKVVEYGERSIRLIPEFESVTYLVDEYVLHGQRFDEVGEWDIPDGAMLQSHLNLTESGQVASVEDSDDVYLNHSESARYGIRFDGNLSEGDQIIEISAGAGDITVEKVVDDYEVNGVSFGFDLDDYEDDYVRLLISVSDGEFSAGIYDDSYNEEATVEDEAFDGDVEDVDEVQLGGLNGGEYITYSHFYASTLSQDISGMTDPNGMDEDMWRPEDSFDERMEIDYDDADVVADSSSEIMHESYRIKEENLTDFEEASPAMSGSNVIDYAVQTEDGTGEFGERGAYFQGWNNVRNTVESNLHEHIAEVEGTSADRIVIVDYLLSGLNLASQFDGDFREEVREAYAESVLKNADEQDFYLIFPEYLKEMDEADDDFYHPAEDYTGEWWEWSAYTVDELIEETDLERMEIDGRMRYGTEEKLMAIEEGLTQHRTNIAGIGQSLDVSGSVDIDEDWSYISGNREFNVITAGVALGAIALGTYGVTQTSSSAERITDSMLDTVPDVDDWTEMTEAQAEIFQDIIDEMAIDPADVDEMLSGQQEFMEGVMTDVTDLAFGSMEIFGESIEDISDMHETTLTEVSSMFDMTTKQFTEMNAQMANMFDGTVTELSDRMELQQEYAREMQMDMVSMHEATLNQFGEISENIINAMDYGDLGNIEDYEDDELEQLVNPKPGEGGLSVQHSNPIITIAVIVIVIIVVFIAVGMVILWNKDDSQEGGSRKSTQRR